MSFLLFDNIDSNKLKEGVIEIYHCSFCSFKESNWDTMKDHYYFNQLQELTNIPGCGLKRKIATLRINGEKSFINYYL
ncbi:MAG TPA: hypothetical protein VFT71_03005 [Candidatus Nitrosocosmicus sp.]|nr:hypothetical protein [Candidatus Nitrosocosmicus sp.]